MDDFAVCFFIGGWCSASGGHESFGLTSNIFFIGLLDQQDPV